MSPILSTRIPWRDLRGLVSWLALILIVAVLGGLATRSSVADWYVQLNQPAYVPPNWVFGPAWTLLYLMIAFAAWRVWRGHGFAGARWALGLFLVQLALNLTWSFLFFGMRRIDLALVDIALLWVAIATTLVLFWRLDRPAGLLLAPYLGWVSFAAVLNHAFWVLNP